MPITGAVGAVGIALMTTLPDALDTHPVALVTVNMYVPVARPDIVTVAPVPVNAPGLIVQVPAGKPVSITLPVVTVHVGCVIVPATGAVGVAGCAAITTLTDAGDIHPDTFVTVKL